MRVFVQHQNDAPSSRRRLYVPTLLALMWSGRGAARTSVRALYLGSNVFLLVVVAATIALVWLDFITYNPPSGNFLAYAGAVSSASHAPAPASIMPSDARTSAVTAARAAGDDANASGLRDASRAATRHAA